MIDVCALLIKYVMISGGLMICGFLTDIIIKWLFDNDDHNDDNDNDNDNDDLDNLEDKG